MEKRDFKQVFRGANPKGEIVDLAPANGTHAVCCVIIAHVFELVGVTVFFFICLLVTGRKWSLIMLLVISRNNNTIYFLINSINSEHQFGEFYLYECYQCCSMFRLLGISPSYK